MKKKIIILILSSITIIAIYKSISSNSKVEISISEKRETTRKKAFTKLKYDSQKKAFTKLKFDPQKKLAWNNHPHMATLNDKNDPRMVSLREAYETKKFPERFSVAITPPKFNKQLWLKDSTYRQRYIHTVEPGRIHHHHAQPGPGVPILKIMEGQNSILEKHTTVQLSVKAPAGSPVNWYSFDGGLFTESKLNSVTVIADSSGVAKVTWYAQPGTVNDARVAAASPLCYGLAEFRLHVSVEEEVLAGDQPLGKSSE